MDKVAANTLTKFSTGAEVRRAARQTYVTGQTSGMAPGFVQGNVVILPIDLAADFQRFCARNPKPCPLLAASEVGSTALPELAADLDIRTDVPRYRVFEHGELTDEPTSIAGYWRDDLVVFVIGCSFSFEEALIENGIPLRHIDEGKNVSMYRTSIQAAPAGLFHGPVVVSMRPMRPADAIRAIQITTRFPSSHGAPIHIGQPWSIGIDDLSKPDYGNPVEIKADEIPVFWACGVTPQAVIAEIKPPFCMTHAPGAMLVTDRLNAQAGIF